MLYTASICICLVVHVPLPYPCMQVSLMLTLSLQMERLSRKTSLLRWPSHQSCRSPPPPTCYHCTWNWWTWRTVRCVVHGVSVVHSHHRLVHAPVVNSHMAILLLVVTCILLPCPQLYYALSVWSLDESVSPLTACPDPAEGHISSGEDTSELDRGFSGECSMCPEDRRLVNSPLLVLSPYASCSSWPGVL